MASVAAGRREGRLAHRLLVWAVPVALALIAYRSSLTFELVGDAVPLIEQNPLMRDAGNLRAMATRDYFWSPAGEAIGYWRPLTKVSWLLETLAGGGRPWVYQAVQLAWLAAATAGVAALALALGIGLLPSALAAGVFALHPATIEPASLVMARSDLACAAATVWAAASWLRWREHGAPGSLALHVVALLVAFGSKETAIVLLPALAAWSLPGLAPAGGTRNTTAAATVRGLGPAAAAALCYLALRSWFLGPAADVPFKLEPLRLFAGTGAFLRGLGTPGFATGIRNLTPAEAFSPGTMASACGAWIAAALLAAWAWRRWRAGLPLLVWVFAALTVVLLVGPMRVPGAAGRIALADRWLFAALAPGVVFAAGLLTRIPSPGVRRALVATVAAWIVVMAAAGPRLHEPYGSRIGLLSLEDAQYAATPERFRTAEDECRHAERALTRAASERDVDGAVAIRGRLRGDLACRGSVNAELTVLSLLLVSGRPAEALPLAEALAEPGLLKGRFRARGLALVAEALHANGRAAAALALLERAWRETPGECALGRTLARALSAAGRDREAAEALAESERCEGGAAARRKPNLEGG